ncbi:MAG: C40 family peptidase [Terracoccus sp.]
MSEHRFSPSTHQPAVEGSPATVTVAATTVWAGPDRARDVDAPMVGPDPDLAAWLAAMDEQTDPERGRLGLHGRVLTQLLEGEPVTVVGADETSAWSKVLAPWQPSPGSAGGYPGWVPSAHLGIPGTALSPDAAAHSVTGPVSEPVVAGTGEQEHPALGMAREHLGLRYLWGGLTPLGLDCSGLVHHTWRRFGIVVPRDAYAQAEVSRPVPLEEVQSGDLYFFAHPGRRIHHVGIVVDPGRMLHASETGRVLVEESLRNDRLETLVAAGRLPSP